MKKIFIALVLFVVLVGSSLNVSQFSLLDYFDGDYNVYTSTKVKDSTNLGFCYMSKSVNVDKDSVVGESVKVFNYEPISALKTLNAELITTEVLDDGTVVMYAYTELISDSVKVGNREVNLQLAHNNDYCVIGWPLIMGSF